jgi:hypothetical protein
MESEVLLQPGWQHVRVAFVSACTKVSGTCSGSATGVDSRPCPMPGMHFAGKAANGKMAGTSWLVACSESVISGAELDASPGPWIEFGVALSKTLSVRGSGTSSNILTAVL